MKLHRCIWSLITFALLVGSFDLFSQKVSDKQLIFLNDGLGKVVGQYSFATFLESDKPVEAELDIMLPKQIVDFFPEPPLLKKEFMLRDSGVRVKRLMDPKDTIWKIGFQSEEVNANSIDLDFTAPYEIGELRILAPPGVLQLASSRGSFEKESRLFGDTPWGVLTLSEIKAGESFRVSVSGLRETRTRYWYLVGIVFLASLAALVFGIIRK